MELEDVSSGETQPMSTYMWLSNNPLASSCGSVLTNIYCASRDYNTVTQYTIGGVESVVTYAAGTAKPVYEKVVDKLDTPIVTVDNMIAGKLVNLEEKYPIIGDQPAAIATKSKDKVCSALQSGQETLGSTRAGRLVGYGANLTLSLTEGIVEKVLPPSDSEEEEEETMESEEPHEETPSASNEEKRSFLGLRRRKKASKEEEEEEEEETVVIQEVECSKVETASNVSRAYNLSQVVFYRTLRRLHRLQKQCSDSLNRLQASIEVLKYAKMVSSKVGKQKEAVTEALRDAESRFMQFMSKQCKQKREEPADEFSGWLSSEKSEDDEDIKWLLDSGKKKGVYQYALDYSKSASEHVYKLLQSFSGISSYLPPSLREGADSALKQAKDVYVTLKENNVPSELPWFLLSQVSECVETQIMYCKQLGAYITTALKTRFGKVDQSSDASSHEECEVDEDNEEEKEEEEEDVPDKGEIESGSETYD